MRTELELLAAEMARHRTQSSTPGSYSNGERPEGTGRVEGRMKTVGTDRRGTMRRGTGAPTSPSVSGDRPNARLPAITMAMAIARTAIAPVRNSRRAAQFIRYYLLQASPIGDVRQRSEPPLALAAVRYETPAGNLARSVHHPYQVPFCRFVRLSTRVQS